MGRPRPRRGATWQAGRQGQRQPRPGGLPALKSQGSGRRSLCISLCRPRGTEEATRPAYRVARSGGRAEGGRGPECAFCVPVKNSTSCERSARCSGLQKPPARRQNVRATEPRVCEGVPVCVTLALTRPSFPALGRPGLVRTILGPASHSLCVSRMWTVFRSF